MIIPGSLRPNFKQYFKKSPNFNSINFSNLPAPSHSKINIYLQNFHKQYPLVERVGTLQSSHFKPINSIQPLQSNHWVSNHRPQDKVCNQKNSMGEPFCFSAPLSAPQRFRNPPPYSSPTSQPRAPESSFYIIKLIVFMRSMIFDS